MTGVNPQRRTHVAQIQIDIHKSPLVQRRHLAPLIRRRCPHPSRALSPALIPPPESRAQTANTSARDNKDGTQPKTLC